MNFDKLLIDYVGEFGKYQLRHLLLVIFPTIFTAFLSLSWTFTGASSNFRCVLSEEKDFNVEQLPFQVQSFSIYNNVSVMERANDRKINFDVKKLTNVCSRPTIYGNNSLASFDVVEPCLDGYVWDTSEVGHTATQRWEFVCERQWLKAFIQSLYYLGQFVGSIVFGILGDRLGRKRILVASLILAFVCGSTLSIVPWWPLFAILFLFVGVAHPGIYVNAVVLAVEMVGPRHRLYASALAGTLFSVGQMILGSLAWVLRDYQLLQFSISTPIVICLACLWKIPESARWLWSQNRIGEASAILQQVAKVNKRKLPVNWNQLMDKKVEPSSSLSALDLFKTPKIRLRMLMMFVCWPNASLCYYGLSMNPSVLGGNRYLTFILANGIEIIAIFFVLFFVDRIGRKVILFSAFLLTSATLSATFFIPTDYRIILISLILIGKLTIKAAYNTLYLYTPELFPTMMRSTAMGLCSMTSRFGGTAASYLAMWLADISPITVVLIFGVSSLLSSFCVLFLPETANQHQPETIAEIENFKRTSFSGVERQKKQPDCKVWKF